MRVQVKQGMFKKAPFLPSQPRLAETRLSTGKVLKSPSPPLPKGEWGDFARGAYTTVREHDKGPRTQLAVFLNIPFTTILVVGPVESLLVLNQFHNRDIHKADPEVEWIFRYPGPDHNTHDKNALENVPLINRTRSWRLRNMR